MWLQVCYQMKVPSHFDDMNEIRLDHLDVWDTLRVQVIKHMSTDFNKVIFNASHLNWFLLLLVETLQILFLTAWSCFVQNYCALEKHFLEHENYCWFIISKFFYYENLTTLQGEFVAAFFCAVSIF